MKVFGIFSAELKFKPGLREHGFTCPCVLSVTKMLFSSSDAGNFGTVENNNAAKLLRGSCV